MSSIEKLISSPIAYVPLIQKNAPEALMSRVTPVAFSMDTGSALSTRFCLLFSGPAATSALHVDAFGLLDGAAALLAACDAGILRMIT
ncbi:MAG: hypothetical protein OEN48_15760 [Betaproteobacteria bacterium]|nr:hypothetical protein [Betaproteobacteria bacterium]